MSLSEEFRSNPLQYARVTVMLGDEIIDDTFYGDRAIVLDAEGSSLSYNRLDEARTTGSFTFITMTAAAAEALDPLAGTEIIPYTGIEINGDIHWEPLGRLIIETSTREYQEGSSRVRVGVVDLSEKVRDNTWKQPFSTGGGTYNAAIEAIMANRAPTIAPFRLYMGSYATNSPQVTYTEKEDPWAAVFNLARSSLQEAYFDKRGYFVVEPVPDPATQAAVLTLGGDDFLAEIGRRSLSVSRRDVYNGVVVIGEAPWLLFPIRGEYWDDNPVSPTYRQGPFGEKPLTIGNAVATTNTQCAEIALTEFRLRAGVSEEMSFSFLKDPTINVGSLIETAVSGEAQKFYTLDGIDYPMGARPMSATVRRRRL